MALRNSSALVCLGLILVPLAGCPGGGGGASTNESAVTGSTTPTGPATTETTLAPTSTSVTSTATSAATTAVPPTCPDGSVDEGETCDDGNAVNGDGCNNDCTKSGAVLAEYRSGEAGDDKLLGLAVDSDGIVIGGQAGTARRIARFNFELMQQWSETYGDTTISIVTGVASERGVFYAAGAVRSDVDGHDMWVARLSAVGVIEWEDIISSGFGDDYLNQVLVTPDDGLVVTGLASTDGGQTALWTRKYGSDMTPAWTAAYPLADTFNIYPLGPGLAATPDGVVVGWTLPSQDFAELLIAYPTGDAEPLWTQTLPDTKGSIKSLTRDPGGDLVLTGAYDQQIVVRRTTSSGLLAWSRFDCTGRNGRDVAVDSQGDIIVIGDGPGRNGTNIRLCKFSPTGEFRWGKDIDGGFGDDFGFAVGVGPLDRIVAGGWVRSEQANDDMWLAVFSP